MSNYIRITICDPSPIIRSGIKNILYADPLIEIAFEASTHEEVLVNCDNIEMDIILVDIKEQGRTGIKFLRSLRELLPELKIIALNDCKDKSRIIQFIELGVKGFQCKYESTPDEMIHAIHTVYNGGTNLTPGVMDALLTNMQSDQAMMAGNLSAREWQVLDLLAVGKSNNAIADKLSISTRTVKSHVSSILGK